MRGSTVQIRPRPGDVKLFPVDFGVLVITVSTVALQASGMVSITICSTKCPSCGLRSQEDD